MNQMQYLAHIATDKDFRARLRKDPKSVLAEIGTDTGDVAVKIVEDTSSVTHIAMPNNPNVLLDDSSLEDVAGGGWNPFKKKSWKKLEGGGGKSSFGSIGSSVSSLDIADVD